MLLEAARGIRREALYTDALHTRLRQSELLGLRWDDVDLEGGRLLVRRSLKVTNHRLDFGPPQNKASCRAIPLNRTAVAALRAHRVRQNEEKLAAPSGATMISSSPTVSANRWTTTTSTTASTSRSSSGRA